MPYSDFFTDESQFCILDLSQSPQSGTKVDLRGWMSSEAAISTDLRRPIATSSVRVVLWSVGKPDSCLENTLGQALNIETRFFQAAHAKKARFSDSEPERASSRPLVPPYAEIGENLIRIVTNHQVDEQSSVSIILIAGNLWQTNWITEEFGGEVPSLDTKTSHGHLQEVLRWGDNIDNGYVPLLHWCLVSGSRLKRTITITSLIFGALLPLVYSSTFSIMDRSNRVRLAYTQLLDDRFDDSTQKESAIFDLYSQRLGLRRVVESSEDDSEQLARYITSQGLTDLKQDYTDVQKHYKSVYTSALRLEAEISDYLELQSGRMALQESQKSILLSNLQIEEYKRGSSLPKPLEIFAFNKV